MSVEKAEKVVLQERSLNYFCSQWAGMKQESGKGGQHFYYLYCSGFVDAYKAWFYRAHYLAFAFWTRKVWCKFVFSLPTNQEMIHLNYSNELFFRGRKQRLWTCFWGATHWYHLPRRIFRWTSFDELQGSSSSFSYLQVIHLFWFSGLMYFIQWVFQVVLLNDWLT